MKKIHIILLVLIAGAIGLLTSFLRVSTTTYETIPEAKAKQGKFVHVAAKLDTTSEMVYDELKDPNFLSFTAYDTTGEKMKVIYRDGKIPNLEISERLVLEGTYKGDHFECERVQTKCPSKYKDDMNAAGKNINKATGGSEEQKNSPAY